MFQCYRKIRLSIRESEYPKRQFGASMEGNDGYGSRKTLPNEFLRVGGHCVWSGKDKTRTYLYIL